MNEMDRLENDLDYYVSDFNFISRWCASNPGFSLNLGPVRVKRDKILACKDKDEFRSLLETELAIAKLIG